MENSETRSSQKIEGLDLDQMTQGNRPRILVVDDEPDTVQLIKHIFQYAGFDVSGANSGKDAIAKMAEVHPSIVLLDIMMPEMDGWQTYTTLRKISDLPVVVISALGQTDVIVKALQMGVDDYITKPFNNEEVIARVKNVLRRIGTRNVLNRIGFPDLELILDLDTQELFYKGKRIQLTGKMFEVLSILANNAPRLVSYDDLTEKIWGEKTPSSRNRLKYLVYLLRQEMDSVDHSMEVIKNVDRLGYKLVTTKE